MGTFKYLLFVPFAATVALGMDDADNWSYHMLVIAAMRYVHSQFWISLSRIHYVTQNTKIQDKGIDFKQVDREDHWDDFIILQAIIMTLVQSFGPGSTPSPRRMARGCGSSCCFTPGRQSSCTTGCIARCITTPCTAPITAIITRAL